MNGNIFHYKVDKNWKISRLSFQILHQAGTYLCDKGISIFSFLKIKVQQDPNIGKYALNKVTLRYRHTSNLKKKKKKIYKYQSLNHASSIASQSLLGQRIGKKPCQGISNCIAFPMYCSRFM